MCRTSTSYTLLEVKGVGSIGNESMCRSSRNEPPRRHGLNFYTNANRIRDLNTADDQHNGVCTVVFVCHGVKKRLQHVLRLLFL